MKINRLHTLIGILLVIIPFTGFSRDFKSGFTVLAGCVILYFAMRSIHDEIMKKHHRHRRHDSFVENKPKEPSHAKTSKQAVESAPETVIENERAVDSTSSETN